MVDLSDVQRRKKSVRRDSLVRRDALDLATRAAASVAIARRVASRVIGISTIALYATTGSEVETTPLDTLLRSGGHRVVYPRVTDGARALTFHPVDAIGELIPSGRLQIREPRPETPAIALRDIAMFVIPGIAFDAVGTRLGWGRGHYDATLVGLDADLVGVAFDCQVVPRIGFDEAHDIHMHAVVTERMTYVRT